MYSWLTQLRRKQHAGVVKTVFSRRLPTPLDLILLLTFFVL